jgi:DNA mismatch repair protein MutL
MGRIRVLEEAVQNQIAAGEVIERPASVVKELVENALDAGAARIDIAVEGGGADRIRVADDGCGMTPEDALLAFERHATSKIRQADDLRSVRSFGFRGEALPSIASVARVTLTTSPDGREGTRVRIRGGVRETAAPAPHPRGTTIEVEGLFCNAPARRKFLRSRATETAHIADLVGRVAAAHPAIAFRLASGGRELASWPAVAGLAERLAQIAGRPDAAHLVPIEAASGALRVVGRASGPGLSRSTGRDQHLFVNGRPIRDRRLLHAVQEAYATVFPKGRFPVLYLFLEVPAGEVDVNVHPAKAEVRFRRAGAVHDLVRDALLEGLGLARPFRPLGRPPRSVLEPAASWLAPPEPRPAPAVAAGEPGGGGAGPGGPAAGPERGADRGIQGAAPPLPLPAAVEPLAQYRDSYILASSPDGLVIVDQHAAHERVLYERFLRAGAAGKVERQRLLFPVTLEVGAAERQAYEEAAEALAALGFGVGLFEEGALIVDEIPALVPAGAVDTLVRELLAETLEWRRPEGIDRLRHRIAASTACHAAVTANHPLDPPRMRRLLGDLMTAENPMTCPHGRPALLRLSLDRLEREFGRR